MEGGKNSKSIRKSPLLLKKWEYVLQFVLGSFHKLRLHFLALNYNKQILWFLLFSAKEKSIIKYKWNDIWTDCNVNDMKKWWNTKGRHCFNSTDILQGENFWGVLKEFLSNLQNSWQEKLENNSNQMKVWCLDRLNS